MKIIREVKYKNKLRYFVYINNIEISCINIRKRKISKDEKMYILLFYSNGILIEPVFEFLNHYLSNIPINTREAYSNALKLLYSFLEIKNKEIEELTSKDIRELSDFISGVDMEGDAFKYYFCHSRSSATHNQYFNLIRMYLQEMNIINKLFFKLNKSNAIGSTFIRKYEREYNNRKKYDTNKSSYNSSETVPQYISIYEFVAISNIINNSNSNSIIKWRDILIVSLMYTRGMRLGEVLGLTFEDIKVNKNGDKKLILRNRCSDKKYQCAKGCENVSTTKDYSSKSYRKKNIGFQEIYINNQIYELINKYINISRNSYNLSEKVESNILKFTRADLVEQNSGKNYYIFLNKNGTPLSSGGWNKRLKKYFEECKINIDEKIKEKNLSHRFRHGYAMYLIEIEKKKIEFVQKELRHRSIQSTLQYYNPTEDEIIRKTNEINNNILKESFVENSII